MLHEAALREKVQNVMPVDQRGHNQDNGSGAVLTIIEQTGRAFVPQHRRQAVMAAEGMATIGFKSGEVSIGPTPDLAVQRGGDFIWPERVDFVGERVQLLARDARWQPSVLQDG